MKRYLLVRWSTTNNYDIWSVEITKEEFDVYAMSGEYKELRVYDFDTCCYTVLAPGKEPWVVSYSDKDRFVFHACWILSSTPTRTKRIEWGDL